MAGSDRTRALLFPTVCLALATLAFVFMTADELAHGPSGGTSGSLAQLLLSAVALGLGAAVVVLHTNWSRQAPAADDLVIDLRDAPSAGVDVRASTEARQPAVR